jgi:hypothetical protein
MDPLADIAPPSELNKSDKAAIFQHFRRHIARYRNTVELYATAEASESSTAFLNEIDTWANDLLKNAWTACNESGKGESHLVS